MAIVLSAQKLYIPSAPGLALIDGYKRTIDSTLKNEKPSGGAFSMDDVGKTLEKPEKKSRSSLETFPSYEGYVSKRNHALCHGYN